MNLQSAPVDVLSQVTNWEITANRVRCSIVDMVARVNVSHIGCSLSIVDLLVVLYSSFIDIEAIKHKQYPRDFFILSKGHAVSALYSTHAMVGLIPESDLEQFYKNGTKFAGHPIKDTYPGIEASTGSLGHGLSLGVGIALALKHDNHPNKVYVMLGDGECQEGSIWEALDAATRFKLDNLVIMVDKNDWQGLDRTEDISGKRLAEKLAAFGCSVHEIDGHDHAAIAQTLFYKPMTGMPTAIIAKTIKSKGVSFMEDKLEWHYKAPLGDLYETAKKELRGL